MTLIVFGRQNHITFIFIKMMSTCSDIYELACVADALNLLYRTIQVICDVIAGAWGKKF